MGEWKCHLRIFIDKNNKIRYLEPEEDETACRNELSRNEQEG